MELYAVKCIAGLLEECFEGVRLHVVVVVEYFGCWIDTTNGPRVCGNEICVARCVVLVTDVVKCPREPALHNVLCLTNGTGNALVSGASRPIVVVADVIDADEGARNA